MPLSFENSHRVDEFLLGSERERGRERDQSRVGAKEGRVKNEVGSSVILTINFSEVHHGPILKGSRLSKAIMKWLCKENKQEYDR